MSWFWRGFQSAIFYYVSCAPCTKLAYQRKRAKQTRRAEKETVGPSSLSDTQPEFYQHPSPFSTNIYWREEMVLGPGPPPKKGQRDKVKGSSSRDLNTGGQGSSVGGSSADTTLVVGSIDGLEAVQEAEDASGEGWNRRRYQRPDELLWGFDVGMEESRMSGGETYYLSRNPAVNDLHPPVVSSHPTRKSETRWMLQPPPSAKVMEGKERANRSRSVSGASYGSSKKTVSLGRQMNERTLEQKAKRGEPYPRADGMPVPDKNGDPSKREGGDGVTGGAAVADEIQGQPHDRDLAPSSDLTTKKRPSPINISEDWKTSSNRKLDGASENIPSSRSALSTIRSATHGTASLTASTQASPGKTTIPLSHTKSARSTPRSPNMTLSPDSLYPPLATTVSNSSLHILQELISPSSALNARAPSPNNEANIRLPSATQKEEYDLRLPELESRFPGSPNFGWGRQDERSNRPDGGLVSGRWSMDI
ncbi:hypothetical protein MMC19_001113 [Ptychographa xylographoides]|nr:hypothetical protein [Ptychographa xylographoides]